MTDFDAMQLALAQARLAAAAGEVPVGAVILKDGVVIATGRNAPIDGHDPTAHAEINALRAAAQVLGNYRLEGCELFVTLEPCTMCSGAMLHARLQRVVFGASDAKTGAAGSVINVFAQAQLNHQTQVLGGVQAEECTALLQDFFQQRRADHKRNHHPLREDALRTPDTAFGALPLTPWASRFTSDLPALGGLRMHYWDERPATAADQPLTYLLLHGFQSWSYGYRALFAALLHAGHRAVAPDLVGFGKSDKPKKESFHRFATHQQILQEFMVQRDLQQVVLVLPADSARLGLAVAMALPQQIAGVLAIGCAARQSEADSDADRAPFPDKGSQAGPRAFPAMLAQTDKDFSSQAVRTFVQGLGPGRVLRVAEAARPMGPADIFQGATQWTLPASAQEPGAAIAHRALAFFSNSNLPSK
ncbi:tRNA adenosine(34) deaminase TadA [Rhodoferax sp.]|uniref:tRNA adenosine(34) deaminase TadA n=1 Tax=Rhodoferax sp. TaxID=50421 RepID=UPI0025DFE975|nr:tRNA adenosine(34) deaminase TadA [Rhodoferax sp.]